MDEQRTGALADEELEAVSGGLYAGDGRMVVTVGYCCNRYQCKLHDLCQGSDRGSPAKREGAGWVCAVMGERHTANCGNCRSCVYERGLWLCNDRFNIRD